MFRLFPVILCGIYAFYCCHSNQHSSSTQFEIQRYSKFKMEAIRVAFGNSVKLLRNTNLDLAGLNNDGTVQNNCNGRLDATNSILNLQGNTNINLSAKDANISILNSSNLNVSAVGKVKVDMNGDTNSKITLSGNGSTELESKDNTNSKILSSGSILKLLKNTNIKVELQEGTLTAEDNTNLSVTGFGGTAVVKGTTDHEISRLIGDDTVNKIDFSFKPSRSTSIGGMFSNVGRLFGHTPSVGANTNEVKVTIEYAEEANIQEDQYKLGIFQFQVAPEPLHSKTEYVIKMSEQSVDPGSLEMQKVLPSKVIFTAMKNGMKQSLSISTPPDTGKVDGSREDLKINLLSAPPSNI